ncbi:MAG TPA: glutathione S-transferase N-terminal domain-containing protein [Caulobacteraceae bacterium]|nr:glutathione S-transferase N-terminal domain-containing protein [Caulobacteraceae bacterium]
MRLYLSTGSPFVRKCRVVIREKGLLPKVEEVAIDFPYKSDPGHLAANPIGQVPALVADDGTTFFNSPVICAYLDSLSGDPRLLPREGPDHWRVRRLETLGDGMNEMTVKQVLESRRPEQQQSAQWKDFWMGGLMRALDQAEANCPDPSSFDLGSISVAIAATYLDFRLPSLDWRAAHPKLHVLRDALEARDSFKETYPR